jgi:hypothetical protein
MTISPWAVLKLTTEVTEQAQRTKRESLNLCFLCVFSRFSVVKKIQEFLKRSKHNQISDNFSWTGTNNNFPQISIVS